MSKFKTPLSLLLVLAMALGLGPVSAFADEFGNPSFDDNEVGQVIVGTTPSQDLYPGVSVQENTGSVAYDESANAFTVSDESGQTFHSATNPTAEGTVTVEDPIVTTTGPDNAALEVNNIPGENRMTVEAGNVTNEGEGGGVQVINNTAGTIDVKVEDISSNGLGLDLRAVDNGGTVEVTADSITTEMNGNGVYMKVTDGGTVSVTVGEEATANDVAMSGSAATSVSEDAAPVIKAAGNGIVIDNGDSYDNNTDGGKAEAEINGDVEAGQIGVSIQNQDENSFSTVTINGDLEAGDKKDEHIAITSIAIQISNDSKKEESAKVTVHGNVETTGTGLKVSGAGETDVYIEGTLSADQQAVVVDQLVTDNLSLTVWKIEVNGKQAEEGDIVRAMDTTGDAKQNMTQEETERAQTIENSINYIIKIDPQQTGNLSSNKATANANETVTITVTIPEGHTLKAVYTDEGETLTAQDNGDGTFSLTVPVGGGVYVHADFEEIPEPEPEPEPKRKYTQESEPVEMPKQEEKIEDTGMGTGGATAKNEFLSVTDGTARYDLGNGEQKVTLLANTLKTLVKERGLKEFVFVMNGKTYTVKAEDLLAWLASSPSVVLYADGDRLVLDFGGGQVVVLEADDAKAAEQKQQDENKDSLYGTRNVLAGLARGLDTEKMIDGSTSGYKQKKEVLAASSTKSDSSSSLLSKQVDKVETQIVKWQNKMATIIEYYTKQFNALEKLISTMNSQSSALEGLGLGGGAVGGAVDGVVSSAVGGVVGGAVGSSNGVKTQESEKLTQSSDLKNSETDDRKTYGIVAKDGTFIGKGVDREISIVNIKEDNDTLEPGKTLRSEPTLAGDPEYVFTLEREKQTTSTLMPEPESWPDPLLDEGDKEADGEDKDNEGKDDDVVGTQEITDPVGGVVGANTAEVQNVYNTAPDKTEAGTEEKSDIVGGVVGAGIAAVQNVYNTGEVQNNYNTASNETNAQQKQENKSTGTKTNGIYGLDGSGLDLGLDKVSMRSKRNEYERMVEAYENGTTSSRLETSELDSLMEKLYTRMWTFKNMIPDWV